MFEKVGYAGYDHFTASYIDMFKTGRGTVHGALNKTANFAA